MATVVLAYRRPSAHRRVTYLQQTSAAGEIERVTADRKDLMAEFVWHASSSHPSMLRCRT